MTATSSRRSSCKLLQEEIASKTRLQKRLLDLVKADLKPMWIYDAIQPNELQRARMYGPPKGHKEDTHFTLYCL